MVGLIATLLMVLNALFWVPVLLRIAEAWIYRQQWLNVAHPAHQLGRAGD